MKTLFTSFFCFLYTFVLLAQEGQDNYRIIYLKDGGVLKGLCVDTLSSAEGISIQILSGETLFLPSKLITKVTRPKGSLQYIGEGRSVKAKGRYLALHINALSAYEAKGRNIDWKDRRLNIGFHLATGYKFSEQSALGLGMGLDFYPETVLLPVFLDYRGVWDDDKPSKIAFAYNFMIGYSFHTGLAYVDAENRKQSGGIMFYPNIGVRLARKKFSNIFLDWGYKFQASKFEYTTWNWRGNGSVNNIENRWYKSLTFRIGWEF